MGLSRLIGCWLLALACLCGAAHGQARVWDWEATPAGDAAGGIPELITFPETAWSTHMGADARCGPVPTEACPPNENEQNPRAYELWEWHQVALTPAMVREPELALLLNDGFPVYEVYVNGTLIGSSGNMATGQGQLYSRQIFRFPQSLVREGKVMIAAHMLTPRAAELGTNEPSLLGMPAAVEAGKRATTLDELRSNWPHFLSFFLIFAPACCFWRCSRWTAKAASTCGSA